jgi:hypothetical protein
VAAKNPTTSVAAEHATTSVAAENATTSVAVEKARRAIQAADRAAPVKDRRRLATRRTQADRVLTGVSAAACGGMH